MRIEDVGLVVYIDEAYLRRHDLSPWVPFAPIIRLPPGIFLIKGETMARQPLYIDGDPDGGTVLWVL